MNGLELLVAALNSTFGPNTDAINEGERFLRGLESQPSYPQALLRIVAAQDMPPQTQLAAAIALKRVVCARWGSVCKEDDAFVRENILSALCSASSLGVRKQLAVVVGTLAKTGYVDKHHSVMDTLSALVTSNSFSTVHGALMAIAAILKNFCFMNEQGTDPACKYHHNY